MSASTSPATGRTYGLERVARVWSIARSTVHHREKRRIDGARPRRRPGPMGACDDVALLEHIRAVLGASRFTGEGHRKVWARLRFAGIRTSRRRVLRLMGEHGLLAPHRVRPPRKKVHDGVIATNAVDVMWGTDMTETVTTKEGVARIFVAVDHCGTECVGIHAAPSGNRFEALEPIRQAVRRCFGAFGENVARGLKLRHDHGSNYMARDFQAEIAFLGIQSSPSFVREPEGNGVAERFIRTLKENFLWVHTFETIEELRRALIEFAEWYNTNWLVQRHGYNTPTQVRANQRQAVPWAA